MIRTSTYAALAIAAAFSALHAVADTGDQWFVTAQYGQADYEVTLEDDGQMWWGDVDDDGDAFALGFGYYVLPQLGIRVMYERVGGVGADNRCSPDPAIQCVAISFTESTRTDQWSVVAMPRLRLGDGWELYATAGAMHWRIDPDDQIADDDGTDFLYGAGLAYRFGNGLRVGTEYQATATDYQALRLTAGFEF